MPVICLLIFVFWIVISIYLAEQFYEVVQEKGYDDRKYFWICFWFGIPGYLLVIALPSRSNTLQTVSDELPDL